MDEHWMRWEKELIVEEYKNKSASELAGMLGRSAGAIRQMAYKLGLRKR